MNELDVGVIGIVLVSLLIGLWRGFLYEALSLLGWPIAFVLSRFLSGSVAPLLPIAQEAVRITAAYALVFVAALIAWVILTKLISGMMKSKAVVWTDRLMGGLFGVLRGGLVVLVLVWFAGVSSVPEQSFWRGALMSRTLEDIALLTKAWLPDDIAKRVHYRTRS
jgi:membrane protein required for colicin V production